MSYCNWKFSYGRVVVHYFDGTTDTEEFTWLHNALSHGHKVLDDDQLEVTYGEKRRVKKVDAFAILSSKRTLGNETIIPIPFYNPKDKYWNNNPNVKSEKLI